MNEELVEIRNPKAEARMESEGRNPKTEPAYQPARLFGFRVSALLRPSDFGPRICPAVVLAAALLTTFNHTPVMAQSAIPDRPEKLTYPPLVYEPPAPEKFRVQLKNGPVAYVVPDRELPLVNIVVYARTGSYLEPAGQEGLAELTGYLLARGGTKSKTAEDLEERLAFLAAQLNSGIGESQGSVSLNLLSKDLDEGLGILREVLSAPRFQDDKIALRKQQTLQAMKERNDESASIEVREQGFLAFGEQFWANRYSTAASVDSIQRGDLEKFHQQWFHPANFIVAASGDFDRDQMVQKLEALFADWPFKGAAPPPIPTNTTFAAPGVYLVDKDVNQGRVAMMLPGILRDNPDYFAAVIMNDILGGGGRQRVIDAALENRMGVVGQALVGPHAVHDAGGEAAAAEDVVHDHRGKVIRVVAQDAGEHHRHSALVDILINEVNAGRGKGGEIGRAHV